MISLIVFIISRTFTLTPIQGLLEPANQSNLPAEHTTLNILMVDIYGLSEQK